MSGLLWLLFLRLLLFLIRLLFLVPAAGLG
jgi:hypothetical protein